MIGVCNLGAPLCAPSPLLLPEARSLIALLPVFQYRMPHERCVHSDNGDL